MAENDLINGGNTCEEDVGKDPQEKIDGEEGSEEKKPMSNPFAYDMIEEVRHISLMTQREASYKKTAEETFIPDELGDYTKSWAVFRDNIEAPTPRIMEIDGYKSEEEISDGE